MENLVGNVHNFSETVFDFVFMVTKRNYAAPEKVPFSAAVSGFFRLFRRLSPAGFSTATFIFEGCMNSHNFQESPDFSAGFFLTGY